MRVTYGLRGQRKIQGDIGPMQTGTIYKRHENQQEAITKLTQQLVDLIAKSMRQAIEQGQRTVTIQVGSYHPTIVDEAVTRWREQYPLDDLAILYRGNHPDCVILTWFESDVI